MIAYSNTLELFIKESSRNAFNTDVSKPLLTESIFRRSVKGCIDRAPTVHFLIANVALIAFSVYLIPWFAVFVNLLAESTLRVQEVSVWAFHTSIIVPFFASPGLIAVEVSKNAFSIDHLISFIASVAFALSSVKVHALVGHLTTSAHIIEVKSLGTFETYSITPCFTSVVASS